MRFFGLKGAWRIGSLLACGGLAVLCSLAGVEQALASPKCCGGGGHGGGGGWGGFGGGIGIQIPIGQPPEDDFGGAPPSRRVKHPPKVIKVVECRYPEVRVRGGCGCAKGFKKLHGECVKPAPAVVRVPAPEPVRAAPTPVAPKPVAQTIASKQQQCVPKDLHALLVAAYGPRPGLRACEAACTPKPLAMSPAELDALGRRNGIEWCDDCVRLGGYLPLADILRLESLTKTKLCMADALCRAPGYVDARGVNTIEKVRTLIRKYPLTAGKEGGIAVVVGNEVYGSGLPRNASGHNDADAVVTLLTEQLGYRKADIIDLRDATRKDLERVFGSAEQPEGELARRVRQNGRGDVFVYVSSHGAADAASGRSYVLPVDTRFDQLERSAYSTEQLEANLGKVGAQQVMLMLEVSFGSAISDLIDPPNLPESEIQVFPQTPIAGLAVFTASDRDQKTLDDPEFGTGLFTRYLIEGMAGQSDVPATGNADRRIDMVELHVYTSHMVRMAARKSFGMEQKPLMSEVQNLVVGKLAQQ
jgi:hypothetical protein